MPRRASAGDRATILHADLDAFYASVEQRDNPELRGRPVIVGGGVVLAASYEARKVGVRSAMNGREAARLCPHAAVVSPRFEAYSEASKAVFDIFDSYTPLVEALSADEAFLDVSGAGRLFGSPVDIAADLRRRVRDEVRLPLSVGVARTKFLAKVASAQSKPDGLLVVEPDRELEFLHPLPTRALWGVGPVTADRLKRHGITTVGQLADLDDVTVVSLLGTAVGRHLRALAWNTDPRAIVTRRRSRSIGSQRALGHRTRSADEYRSILLGLVERVTPRLRSGERLAGTVTVRGRDADMGLHTRSRTFHEPTDRTSVIAAAAQELLTPLLELIENPTLVGVNLSNLCEPDAVQLALPFDTKRAKQESLDRCVDSLNDRFDGAVTRAGAASDDRQFALAVPGRTD